MSVAASSAPDEASVVSKALLRAAEALGLSSAELAEIIGTSESTLSRVRNRKRGPIPLGTKEGELALLFLRVFRSLDALVGGNEAHAKGVAPRREPSRWGSSASAHEEDRGVGRCRRISGRDARNDLSRSGCRVRLGARSNPST